MRYDPIENLIEIQRRGVKTNIDLKQYQRSAMSDSDDLKRIKYSIGMNFLSGPEARVLLQQGELTTDECIDLIKDMTRAFIANSKTWPTLSAPHPAPIYNGPMAFVSGLTLEEMRNDPTLRFQIEQATEKRLTHITTYDGRVFEIMYNEPSATSADPQGGDHGRSLNARHH